MNYQSYELILILFGLWALYFHCYKWSELKVGNLTNAGYSIFASLFLVTLMVLARIFFLG